MMPTVAHRRDTVAMKLPIATVASPCATRVYVSTVAHRRDDPDLRARTGARAQAREENLRTMGTVATVRDGNRSYGIKNRSAERRGDREVGGRGPERRTGTCRDDVEYKNED